MRTIDYFKSVQGAGTTTRLKIMRVVVAGAYACGMLVSPRLWFGLGRTIPRAPLVSGLPGFLSSGDFLLSILLLAALALAGACGRPRRYLAAVVLLTGLLVVLDLTRLQPWVYQYTVMLSALAFSAADALDPKGARPILAASQLIIAALYFWSGAQKLNWSFGHEVLPGLLESAGIHLPAAFVSALPAAGIGIALFESMVGVALLVRRTRRLAALGALGIHLLVLLMLVSARHNSVVWPWNMAMMIMVVLLFWRVDFRPVWQSIRRWHGSDLSDHAVKAVFILCGLMPALSFAGWWDLYLSAALYSGNAPIAVVRISEQVRDRLPAVAQRQVFTTTRGESMLPLFEWSIAELNVPPYPAERVYWQLARQLCVYAEEQQELELIVKGRPSIIDGSYAVRRVDCSVLFAR